MKNPLLFLTFALAALSSQGVQAQVATNAAPVHSAPTSASAPADTTDTKGGDRREKLRAAFAQLDLTDAQKAQLKQIKESGQKGKERRAQMLAVLTPEQKAKLIEILKAQGQPGGQ